MTEKATTRPWTCGGLVKCDCPRTTEHCWHTFEEQVDIFLPLGESGPVAIVNSLANAHLIVQAVNSHDALVDALEAAGDELGHIILAHGLNLDPDVLEKIDAALALAKQEAK